MQAGPNGLKSGIGGSSSLSFAVGPCITHLDGIAPCRIRTDPPINLEPLRDVLKMSCFFLYSASRRASLSAQAANTLYYLFELRSPHVNASAKFNRFRNRTDAERFVGVGLDGVLEHVRIEEISESMAKKLKLGPPEEIDGGVLYRLDWPEYRRMHSIWQRVLRMFQR